jgi:DNA helicase-2/ATP-dependent DNA helicase PcrA
MGSSTVNKPSRFLQDIPSHLITGNGLRESKDIAAEEAISAPDGIRAARYRIPVTREQVKEPDIDLPELKAGDHVNHGQFGEGVVVSVKSVNNDAEVVVAFTGIGVKRLLLSFAKLEKV